MIMDKKLKNSLLLLTLALFLIGCRNSNDSNETIDNNEPPVAGFDYKITTSGYSSLVTTEVKLLGYVDQKDNNDRQEVGFVISENSTPTINDLAKSINFSGDGNFEITFDNLKYNTTYYYRSYVKYGELEYGEVKSFKTCGYNVPAGGIVAYDKGNDNDGWRYIEVSVQGIDTGAWSSNQQLITGTTNTLGSGKNNTERIITSSTMPTSTAANKCKNYYLNGYNDWFLPSSDEAYLISKSLGKINRPLPSYIWTSTEKDMKYAFRVKAGIDNYGNIEIQFEDKRIGYETTIIPIRRY